MSTCAGCETAYSTARAMSGADFQKLLTGAEAAHKTLMTEAGFIAAAN